MNFVLTRRPKIQLQPAFFSPKITVQRTPLSLQLIEEVLAEDVFQTNEAVLVKKLKGARRTLF